MENDSKASFKGLEAILRRRRMTRFFAGGPNQAEVASICALALRAPSAGFSQGSHFLVLAEDELSHFWQLSGAGEWFAKSASGVLNASTVVLVLGDQAAYLERYSATDKSQHELHVAENWGTPYWLTDPAMAAENLLLLAEERGWGALLFGLFGNHRLILDSLNVPPTVQCIGAIAIGFRHPDDVATGSPTTRSRRATEEVVHLGTWSDGSTSE